MAEESYDIYVKNTFLVFEPAARAKTEGRRLRAASCPAKWRVHTLGSVVPVATMRRTSQMTDADLLVEKTSFAQSTSITMAPCESRSDAESTESSAVVAHSADAVDGEDTAEELEMHRKINRQLSAGSTPAAILHVVERNLNNMNGINLSTAFHRLSRCRQGFNGFNGSQGKVLAAMLQLAEAKATQELHCGDGTLPANCCTIIAWSCAMLKVFSGPLFSALIAVVAKSARACEGYEVSNLLWACVQYQKAAVRHQELGATDPSMSSLVAESYDAIAFLVRGYFSHRQFEDIKTSVLLSAFTSTAALLPNSNQKRVLLKDLRNALRRRLSELSELQRKLVFGPKWTACAAQ